MDIKGAVTKCSFSAFCYSPFVSAQALYVNNYMSNKSEWLPLTTSSKRSNFRPLFFIRL